MNGAHTSENLAVPVLRVSWVTKWIPKAVVSPVGVRGLHRLRRANGILGQPANEDASLANRAEWRSGCRVPSAFFPARRDQLDR